MTRTVKFPGCGNLEHREPLGSKIHYIRVPGLWKISASNRFRILESIRLPTLQKFVVIDKLRGIPYTVDENIYLNSPSARWGLRPQAPKVNACKFGDKRNSVTVLPPHPSVVRQWLRGGDVDKLESVVIQGQGHKLLGEYASDLKVRAFLKTIPAYLARIDMVHEAAAKGNLTDLKTLLKHNSDQQFPRKKLASLALSKDHSGTGLLHKAVYHEDREMARWLVDNYPGTVTVRDRVNNTTNHKLSVSEAHHSRGWQKSHFIGNTAFMLVQTIDMRTQWYVNEAKYIYLTIDEFFLEISCELTVHQEDIN
ncbi:hypothetical protein J6590_003702 [Homalodisca vitripennis]|nr:hypothetical protein J6590_003702 [Homalodisca vitripennis]